MLKHTPLLVLLLVLGGPQLRAAASLEAYGRLPSLEFATLSPDGSKIAFIQVVQESRLLEIVDIVESKLLSRTHVGEEKVRSVQWADDSHLLLTTASSLMPMDLVGERQEWRLMQVFNLATGQWKPLMTHSRTDIGAMNVVIGRPVIARKDGETILFIEGLTVRDESRLGLFRISLTSGKEDLVNEGSVKTRDWLLDDTGEIIAEQLYSEKEQRWDIRLYSGERVRQTVSGNAAIEPPAMLGLSADGDQILCAVKEADGVALKPLQIRDGAWGSRLNLPGLTSGPVLKEGSNRMIGTAADGERTEYRFLDKSLQEGWDWTTRVFGNQRTEFISVSADHAKIIVEVMGEKSGYAFFLADLKEHLTVPVGKIYQDITRIAEVRPIRYPAADGLTIPAYLTLPPERAAKNLPLIVLPHGGPQWRDEAGFDWWAQALASQGYAVLQPNYRGSALNEQWIEAGYGEWGRKMQTDLSDGLRYLAAQGLVDPNRVCIVGASYGGYAALAGVSIQSGIYRCAVAVAAVSDPILYLQWVARRGGYRNQTATRYWERFLGVDNIYDKGLDAISPLRNAGKIAVPLLLIHGREDTTVPYEQSADLARALKREGKPFEFVTLEKEDHYLSRSATRLQMLKSSVEFLRKYNPPD